MKEGYYWYSNADDFDAVLDDTSWIILLVLNRGGEFRAYIGESSTPIIRLHGEFRYIPPPDA